RAFTVAGVGQALASTDRVPLHWARPGPCGHDEGQNLSPCRNHEAPGTRRYLRQTRRSFIPVTPTARLRPTCPWTLTGCRLMDLSDPPTRIFPPPPTPTAASAAAPA